MFNSDGTLDKRSQRILSKQTIPPRYGRSPGMDALANCVECDKPANGPDATAFNGKTYCGLCEGSKAAIRRQFGPRDACDYW